MYRLQGLHITGYCNPWDYSSNPWDYSNVIPGITGDGLHGITDDGLQFSGITSEVLHGLLTCNP